MASLDLNVLHMSSNWVKTLVMSSLSSIWLRVKVSVMSGNAHCLSMLIAVRSARQKIDVGCTWLQAGPVFKGQVSRPKGHGKSSC